MAVKQRIRQTREGDHLDNVLKVWAKTPPRRLVLWRRRTHDGGPGFERQYIVPLVRGWSLEMPHSLGPQHVYVGLKAMFHARIRPIVSQPH
eukprot:3833645-Rhodomonas_salina.1